MAENETATAPDATPGGGQSDLRDRATESVAIFPEGFDRNSAALKLIENGYHPVPIALRTKACFLGGWPRWCMEQPIPAEIARWDAQQFGIAGGTVVAIDLDLLDEAKCDEIEQLARLQLGDTPLRRVGRAPKRLLVYRAEGPVESTSRAGLDVIAHGRQFVAFAVHPDTGRPYSWGARNPLDTPLADLPGVTQEQVDAFVEATELPLLEGPGGGRLQARVFDLNTGLVIDGREAHLYYCCLDAVNGRPKAPIGELVEEAWENFTRTTDLSKPHHSQPFTKRDARDKVRRVQRDFASGRKRRVPQWEMSKGAIVRDSQENIRLALEALSVELSFDEFAARPKIRSDGGSPATIDDAVIDDVWLQVDATWKFRPSRSFFETVAMSIARRNAFHPVRDYLDSLAWDGTPRIDRWLVDYAGAEDSEYTRAVGALLLVAAVRRVRSPGCKFDEMVILEGTQGVPQKSSALSTLCPSPDWFSDSLPLGVDPKVVMERTVGKWIVEAGELHGMPAREIIDVKAFLSRTKDGPARLAYDRLPSERARHFVVVGTTNSDDYLEDTTGNRRFWPVKVEAFDLPRLLADRDQLWAEAAAREARGESIRLPERLWPAASAEQEERRAVHPWEDKLAAQLGRPDESGALCGWLLVDDVWHLVGKHEVANQTKRERNTINAVMRRLGFERTQRRIKGRRPACFERYDEGEIDGERIVVELDRDPRTQRVVDTCARMESQQRVFVDFVPGQER